MPLNRTWLNSLVDDDGSGATGTPWNKAAVSTFHDVIDAGTVPPAPHASTHLQGGADAIPNVTTSKNGLAPQAPGGVVSWLRGDCTWANPDVKTLSGFPANTTTFLRGDGTFAVPPGGGGGGAHAATHAAGGGDTVDVKTLGGFPANTTTFLRGDGTFAVPAGGGGPHATTHQPGGTDPLTALSADILTTGTLADARLTANVVRMVAGQVAMTPTANVGVLVNGAGVPTNGFMMYIDSGATAGWTGTLLHVGIANVQKMAVDQLGTIQAGSNAIRVGNGSIVAQAASDGVVWAHGGVLWLSAAGDIRSTTIYGTTDSSTANLVVSSTGRLARSTSSRRYKTAIEPLTEWRWLLNVRPVTFEPIASPGARRFGGLLAEDVATHGPIAYGKPVFAGLDDDGRPDEVAYDHLHAPVIAAIQDLHARLTAIETAGA
jgi:hypothetical protein